MEESVMEESIEMANMLDIIREIHIDYLESDNVLLREKYYEELRDVILLYLCQKNLNLKFTRAEFADLLKYNIENKPDLSINGMCQAFEALEKYANNLLLFPWRNEYRQIKLNCGFFKHKITQYIDGVEEIFKLMGYMYSTDFTLVLFGPLHRDKLIEVALNCVIASCECSLIQEFHQLAVGSGWQFGYKEVYKLRNMHNDKSPCKYAVDQPPLFYASGHKSKDNCNGRREALHPEEVHKQVPNQNHQTLDDETTKKSPSSRDKTRELLNPETHDRHSISALNLHDLSSNKSAETRAATGGYVCNTLGYNVYETAGKQKIPVEDNDDDDLALRRQQKANQLLEGNTRPQSDGDMIGNRCNFVYPGYNPTHIMAHPMTTLIPCQPPPGYMYGDYTDPRSRIPLYPLVGLPYDQQFQRTSNLHVDGNGHVEPRTSQRSSVYDNVSSDYAHDRVSEQAKQWNKSVNSSKYTDDTIEPMLSPPSPFNKNKDKFLIDFDTSKRQKSETDIGMGKSKRQGIKEKTPNVVQSRESRSEEERNEKRSNSSGSSLALSMDENQWQFPSCTMLNQPGDKICNMCSRSKTKGPEAIPLKSGVKECAQCTYINEPNASSYCSVCLTTLSPGNSFSSKDKTQELLNPETHNRHIEASISVPSLHDISSTDKSLSQPDKTRATILRYANKSDKAGGVLTYLNTTVVKAVLETGVDPDIITQVVTKKIELTGKPYDDANALMQEYLDFDYSENNSTQSKVITPINKVKMNESKSLPSTSFLSEDDSGCKNSPTKSSSSLKGFTKSRLMSVEEENRNLKEMRLCKICMDEEIGVVFLPCGHFICCLKCGPNLKDCPLCRKKIRETVRTFLS